MATGTLGTDRRNRIVQDIGSKTARNDVPNRVLESTRHSGPCNVSITLERLGQLTSNTVTSPSGESIEITTNDDWLELTGAHWHGMRQWNSGGKRWFFRSLWEHGPIIDRSSGQATRKLFERIIAAYPESIDDLGNPTSASTFFRHALNAPAFDRETNGKRTYSIALRAMPRVWFDKLMADIDNDTSPIDPEPTPEPTPEPVAPTEPPVSTDDEFAMMIQGMQLDAPTVYDEPPPLDISIASQVAMSLLTTVVEIITAGSGAAVDEKVRKLQGDLNDVMIKLSQRLEDNDRMRRQLRQAGDEIQALRHERDGLRSRLRATEANLTAALKGDAVQAINGEIQKRVDAIMRVAPKGKGEDD